MEVKLDIPFEQLLQMLRQLTPVQRRKARIALGKEARANVATSSEALTDFLMRGPVFSKAQLSRMEETRKAFEQWRGK